MPSSLHECAASAHGVGLSDGDIARYRDDGAILLKGVISLTVIEDALSGLEDLVSLMEAKHGEAPDAGGEPGSGRLGALSDRLIALDGR